MMLAVIDMIDMIDMIAMIDMIDVIDRPQPPVELPIVSRASRRIGVQSATLDTFSPVTSPAFVSPWICFVELSWMTSISE